MGGNGDRSALLHRVKQWLKTVIFDFDGTLCDNFAEMMAVFGEVVKREGIDFNIANQERLRSQGAKAFFFSLEGLEFWKIKPVLEEVRGAMSRRVNNLKLFRGVELIKNLKEKGLEIGIISSSPKEYIEKVLELNKEEVAYVGDENRDVEAANKAGVESVAVTWGYNNEDLLLASKPKRIVRTFEELIELFI